MAKLSKKTKITFGVVFIILLVLIHIQRIFNLIPIWKLESYLESYYEFRHNYPEVKALTKSPYRMEIFASQGYITDIFYHKLDYVMEEDIAIINSLSGLDTLRITTLGWEDEEKVCSQMALLAKIDNNNLMEFQYDFKGEPWIDCLQLPKSVTTIRIRGIKMGDDDLIKLAKFDQLDEILVYSLYAREKESKRITYEGVKAFNEIRPDVKVWWDDDINLQRKGIDFCDPQFDYLVY